MSRKLIYDAEMAIRSNDVEKIKDVFSDGKLDVNTTLFNNCYYPLYHCVLVGKYEGFKTILELIGKPIEEIKTSIYDDTELKGFTNYYSAGRNDIEMLKFIWNSNLKRDINELSLAIQDAIRTKKDENIDFILSNVDNTAEVAQHGLFSAVRLYPQVLPKLVSYGADPNSNMPNVKYSAIWLANRDGHPEYFDFLKLNE